MHITPTIFSSALYCLRVALRISLTTRSAGAFDCFAFIFVPYSHCNETKTITYFMQPVCLLNADGGQYRANEIHIMVENGFPTALGLRGLDAVRTIMEAGAENQLANEVVEDIYGLGLAPADRQP
jgi:hypothetical protein